MIWADVRIPLILIAIGFGMVVYGLYELLKAYMEEREEFLPVQGKK